MKTLTREKIMGKKPPAPIAVPTPEWADEGELDAGVYVKVMDAAAREVYERRWNTIPIGESKRAFFASLVCCDETGKLIFTPEDVEELAKRDFRPLDRILIEGMKINVVGEEQKDALKKVLESQSSAAGSTGSAR